MATAGYMRHIVRKLALAAAFVLMVTVGYMTMSAATSCPAQAQVCTCGACVALAPGAASGITEIGGQTALQVGAATSIINAQYALAAEAFALQAAAHFAQIVTDVDDWFDTFWHYNERPAMQAQVEQENVMDSIQAATIASFRDAEQQARRQSIIDDIQLRSAQEYQVSTQLCTAGTIAGGLTRANAIRRAYGRAAPVEAARRSGASRGTSGERGTANDIRERWNTARTTYCDASENGGNNGCETDGAMVNADIDVTGTVFMRDTIDLTDPVIRQAADDLVDNIAEPFVQPLVSASDLTSADGIQAMVERDAHRAQRQAIHTALQAVIARRAPGGANGEFLSALRGAAGLTADMFSENPSHNEIMEVMLAERFRSGQYSVSQVDTPQNNARELTVQNAFEVMQNHDMLDLVDLHAMILAVQTGISATESRGGTP